MDRQSLANVRVLVTRPQHQAKRLIENINQLGGLACHIPTIEIIYSLGKPALIDADLIVFTSVNSVIGAQLTATSFGTQNTPLIAAIGTATTNSLRDSGLGDIISPKKNGNSESLLELLGSRVSPAMKVIIVRGDSGRNALRDGLLELGAQVRYEQVYQRKLPNFSAASEKPGELWQQADPHIVSVSSDLGLVNLIALLPATFHQQLFTRPLVVNSERCKQKALAEGFTANVLVADPPGDCGQIIQLISYAQSNYRPNS